MSQASRDAKALKNDGMAVKPLPFRTIAEVGPQTLQLAKDHALVAKSAWCGTVFAVAVVITALNLVPPIDVGYRVSMQVVASPQRFEQLQRHLKSKVSDRPYIAHDQPAELLEVRLLDDHRTTSSVSLQAQQEPLALIEISSLWPDRTTSSKVHQWLNDISAVEPRVIRQVESATKERFTRWQVQARQHYLDHFRHKQLSAIQRENSVGKTASSGDQPPTRFASLSLQRSGTIEAAKQTDAETETALIRELEEASQREQDAVVTHQDQIADIAGVLTISGSPRVRAEPSRVPRNLVFSILILAVASATVGGWAHHRSQSAGVFYADEVGRVMSGWGLPVLGQVQIRLGIPMDSHKLSGRVTCYRRRSVQQLLTISELVVMFWCLAIAIRVVLDPLWRAMLWDNPLAALGRLFLGLP